jgi:hypothetical protein
LQFVGGSIGTRSGQSGFSQDSGVLAHGHGVEPYPECLAKYRNKSGGQLGIVSKKGLKVRDVDWK